MFTTVARQLLLSACLACGLLAEAKLTATESSSAFTLANDRLKFVVTKKSGSVTSLSLDGTSLLGKNNGKLGSGPYLDCHCPIVGYFSPGGSAASYKLLKGQDSTKTDYAGVVLHQPHEDTGEVFEYYWFLRDGETGVHNFFRIAYSNATQKTAGTVGEMRMMFRPNTDMWTHLLTNKEHYAPMPPVGAGRNTPSLPQVQDATWDIAAEYPDSAYVKEESDYFTKYTFADSYRDHDVHGMFADGSKTADGATYGAWLVMFNKETYYQGPLHSDLTVDGIVYNYIVSSHHGNSNPTVSDGFDRTWGPFYYHFNKGSKGASMESLRQEAMQLYTRDFDSDFYDSIAASVPNYVSTSKRGSLRLKINIPATASNPLAVLSTSGKDFQDNFSDDGKSLQYWQDIDSNGEVTIDRVAAGTYRLTVYADGVFGQYTQDDVKISAGKQTTVTAKWTPESHGHELWRIGTPDKTAGEFRHGFARDPNHSLHPEEYRIYWGAYDFYEDFPDGVNFHIGKSNESTDFNYVHWGKYNNTNTNNINNWTVTFDLSASDLKLAASGKATLTMQLAGVSTAAGNTHSSTAHWAQFNYTVTVNGHDLDPWLIHDYDSSSCAMRSGISCRNVAHEFGFDSSLLKAGSNEMVLSIPHGATSCYVQYDAIRLEVA
ncbi:hypothetical protein KEM52_000520 [Ascosphaera acerosa]|nr:hypothetical protein KEM52_000520 [Ascosphaera acerosa]